MTAAAMPSKSMSTAYGKNWSPSTSISAPSGGWDICWRNAGARIKFNPTLRGKLLRLVLVPLSLILLIDIVGSYFIVRNVANDVYDVELNEIARELLLHVTEVDGNLGFDLQPEAERTLLLDKEDQIYYAIRKPEGETVAGEVNL